MGVYSKDKCIEHRADEVDAFITTYFANEDLKCCIIAGAGFDPRAKVISERLASLGKCEFSGFYLKELRSNPVANMTEQADKNFAVIKQHIPNADLVEINIFAEDGAVIGGSEVCKFFSQKDFSEYSDIVIDLSAISIGTSFPLVGLFYKNPDLTANLHLMVAANANVDDGIIPSEWGEPQCIHGFQNGYGLQGGDRKAKLWLPQLSLNKQKAFEMIASSEDMDDICPILPFSCRHPRRGDDFLIEFMNEMRGWDVDSRSILYVAEDNPIDLYRTLLRIANDREKVFEEYGGSMIILSPGRSKMLAIGALMGALELNFPIVYCEAIDYSSCPIDTLDEHFLGHVWLKGSVYPDT